MTKENKHRPVSTTLGHLQDATKRGNKHGHATVEPQIVNSSRSLVSCPDTLHLHFQII